MRASRGTRQPHQPPVARLAHGATQGVRGQTARAGRGPAREETGGAQGKRKERQGRKATHRHLRLSRAESEPDEQVSTACTGDAGPGERRPGGTHEPGRAADGEPKAW